MWQNYKLGPFLKSSWWYHHLKSELSGGVGAQSIENLGQTEITHPDRSASEPRGRRALRRLSQTSVVRGCPDSHDGVVVSTNQCSRGGKCFKTTNALQIQTLLITICKHPAIIDNAVFINQHLPYVVSQLLTYNLQRKDVFSLFPSATYILLVGLHYIIELFQK